jgi:hypothetical protein
LEEDDGAEEEAAADRRHDEEMEKEEDFVKVGRIIGTLTEKAETGVVKATAVAVNNNHINVETMMMTMMTMDNQQQSQQIRFEQIELVGCCSPHTPVGTSV